MTSTSTRTRRSVRWLAPLLVVTSSASLLSQIPQPSPKLAEAIAEAAPLPDVAPSVTRLLQAAYLTDDERKDLRIFHGQWLERDLDTPQRAARAALISGDYVNPAFTILSVDPADRAEARLLSGKPVEAIGILEKAGADTIRSYMLRAQAAEMLGRFDDAVTAIDFALKRGELSSPEDITCGVRMLAQRIRLRGTDDKAALAGGGARLRADPAAYQQMIETLGRVRSDVGARLYWPALLAEAEILYARDNASKAQEALAQVLSLNPSCAAAWAMLGRMSVDAFNFGVTEQIALTLDALAGNPSIILGDPEPGAAFDPAPPRGPASIDAAIIRARAAIRQIDGARAAEVLDERLPLYPTHPQMLAVRAAAEATRFEFDALQQRLAAFDQLYPVSPVALYESGRALAESRQYAASEQMLKAAHQRLPAAPEILAELGLMCVQWGKDDRALEALEKSFALDPFNLRADNTLRLVRDLATYHRVESEHFIVRYKAGLDEVFARDLLGPMEANHAVVTGNGPGGVDHQPFDGTGKTIIDLMPNHAEFGVRIAGMPAIHTIAASTGPVIAMEAPRDGPRHNGTYDWNRVLRHEYTHTVNLDRTKNRIPHWFTEAGAVYLELSPRDYSTCQLMAGAFSADALFDFSEINIAFVRPKKPTDRAQGYAQGHLMYEYIIERWGNKAPLDLMDKYAAGVREEAAFNQVLGVPRDQFMADFKEWTRKQLVAWGMIPPDGVPTIEELLAQATAAKPEPAPLEGEPAAPAADGDQPDAAMVTEEADNQPAEVELTPALAREWLDKHPTHPDLLELVLDDELSKTGGKAVPELLSLIDRYIAARPVDPKPHRLLAAMHLASPDAQAQLAAIPHLEYLDAREQKLTAYATQLARLYFARNNDGDLARAFAKAERATQLAPYEAPPRELAAAIAIKNSNFNTAERHITALTKLEPDRDIHRQRLEALRKMRASEAR